MRKLVILVAAVAVTMAVSVPSAAAHTLSLVRAHDASLKESKSLCSVLDPLSCTGTQVAPCTRL
jgi:hypothetical protein